MASVDASLSTLGKELAEALEYGTNPDVHVADISLLEKKVSTLKSCPTLTQDLLVISDFDYTLSKYFLGTGLRSPTAYCILLGSELISKEFNIRDEELANHYYPLEISSEISEEDRFKICIEWWLQGNELILSTKVNQKLMPEIVKRSGLTLRDGVPQMMQLIHSKCISCLVFSAGLDYVIKVALSENKLLTPNVIVIANEMVWDQEGTIQGMPGPTITSSNKNYKFLSNYPSAEKELNPKKYVILLGDSPGDSNMVVGMPNVLETLRIGFLNLKVEEKLEKYKGLFDVVFTNDIPLHLFINLLRLILTG